MQGQYNFDIYAVVDAALKDIRTVEEGWIRRIIKRKEV